MSNSGTLTFDPDFYKFQKQSSNNLEEFDCKISSIYEDKSENHLCQFWGCHESCPEEDSELDVPNELCQYHEKLVNDVFQTKLTAFITNESDMLTKIRSFISNEANVCLIQHLNSLFGKDNEIYIGEHKKYGVVRDTGDIYMVDNAISLFMCYIKSDKSWLISENHLTEWLTSDTSEQINEELTSITSFIIEDGKTYYIKSLTKENMIEVICHYIANDIRGIYKKQSINVE